MPDVYEKLLDKNSTTQDFVFNWTTFSFEELLGLDHLHGIPYLLSLVAYGAIALFLIALIIDLILFLLRKCIGQNHQEHPLKQKTRQVLHISLGGKLFVILLGQLPHYGELSIIRSWLQNFGIESRSWSVIIEQELPFLIVIGIALVFGFVREYFSEVLSIRYEQETLQGGKTRVR